MKTFKLFDGVHLVRLRDHASNQSYSKVFGKSNSGTGYKNIQGRSLLDELTAMMNSYALRVTAIPGIIFQTPFVAEDNKRELMNIRVLNDEESGRGEAQNALGKLCYI